MAVEKSFIADSVKGGLFFNEQNKKEYFFGGFQKVMLKLCNCKIYGKLKELEVYKLEERKK